MRGIKLSDKNSDNFHSNDAYVDTQESEQYSDAWGERLAQKFKRCLYLKWNEAGGELNLRKVFKKMDKNHDGKVSRKEFHEAIDLLDIDFRESEIRILLQYLDKNDDGGVDLAEFKIFRNIESEVGENKIDEIQASSTAGLMQTRTSTSIEPETITDGMIEPKKKNSREGESLISVAHVRELEAKIVALETQLSQTSSSSRSLSKKYDKDTTALNEKLQITTEKYEGLDATYKKQNIELSNVKKQIATMSKNKVTENKERNQAEIKRLHDEIKSLKTDMTVLSTKHQSQIADHKDHLKGVQAAHAAAIVAMKEEHRVEIKTHDEKAADAIMMQQQLNKQINDLELQLKVEKNKFEVFQEQKVESEEAWKLGEKKRIEEAKKKSELETLETMKEIVQKEADSRSLLMKKEEELSGIKKELELILQLKDLDVEKRKELESRNDVLSTDNTNLKKELMELNSKLAKYIEERDTIEQKTKDELAFQALQHRVEKEKAKLLLLQHKSRKHASQDSIEHNNVTKTRPM